MFMFWELYKQGANSGYLLICIAAIAAIAWVIFITVKVMKLSKKPNILPCKCGRTPTLRYRMPYSWVECKCGRRSKAFADYYEQVDPDAVNDAIKDWNERIVKGETK